MMETVSEDSDPEVPGIAGAVELNDAWNIKRKLDKNIHILTGPLIAVTTIVYIGGFFIHSRIAPILVLVCEWTCLIRSLRSYRRVLFAIKQRRDIDSGKRIEKQRQDKWHFGSIPLLNEDRYRSEMDIIKWLTISVTNTAAVFILYDGEWYEYTMIPFFGYACLLFLYHSSIRAHYRVELKKTCDMCIKAGGVIPPAIRTELNKKFYE